MITRRLPAGLVIPALLIGLVGLLATLQYRWLGKVSEAEREQLSRSLGLRARELTEDFDREITRAYLAFQLSRVDVSANDWTTFAAGIDRWRAGARYPAMVRGIYLADVIDGQAMLRRFDDGTHAFGPAGVAWPAHLEPLRQRFTAESRPVSDPAAASPGSLQLVRLTIQPVAPDIPALVIPLSSPFPPLSGAVDGRGQAQFSVRSAPEGTRWFDLPRAHVIVDLDHGYLSETVLPSLADRHFPRDGGSPYRLAVLTAAGSPIFQRGFQPGVVIDAAGADQVTTFFTLRPDLVPEPESPADPPSPGALLPGSGKDVVVVVMSGVSRFSAGASRRPAEAQTSAGVTMRARVQAPNPGWRLVLQHGAGSLDAAVLSARRRNLWLSFGILAVLAAGVVLVVVNARRSEHLAARQMDFVTTVSHELRTPLAVIRSAAQNLSAGIVAEPAQARRYGALIEDEGRRLTDMVEQVMAYAGLEGSRRVRAPRPVDVQGLVESVVASCRPLCEAAGCAMEVDAGGQGIPPVMGDEAALGRALHNLVTNAVKHGADGHWVGVTVSSCSVRGGQEVQVTVSDRGRGIETSDLARVFEPFHRGRYAIEQQVHGNGLGLNLVKRIVEAHGGRIAVTSTPGAGATFAVYLPAGPTVAPDLAAEAP